MDLEMIRDFRETLRQLERQVGWQLKDDTECCGVTLAQCHIIVEIGNAGETSVIDLATILGLDTSTLSRHINGMVNVGLVNRILNPKDRRYVSITLTEQGQKIYQSIEDICKLKICKGLRIHPPGKTQAGPGMFRPPCPCHYRGKGVGRRSAMLRERSTGKRQGGSIPCPVRMKKAGAAVSKRPRFPGHSPVAAGR